jgi:hypothetical protein
MSTRPSVDELLWSWPFICKSVTDEWSKDFTRSIARKSRRSNWTPSSKQYDHMEQMVTERYASRGASSLIED